MLLAWFKLEPKANDHNGPGVNEGKTAGWPWLHECRLNEPPSAFCQITQDVATLRELESTMMPDYESLMMMMKN